MKSKRRHAVAAIDSERALPQKKTEKAVENVVPSPEPVRLTTKNVAPTGLAE